MRRFLLPILLALCLAACGKDAGAGDGSSGVEGTVSIGPTCPVEHAESPCPDAPYAAAITVSTGGDVVATGESGEDGTFRISVPPGTYEVSAEPLDGNAIAHAEPIENVVVEAGSFTHLLLSFDSGIR
jgi:hypothetical protein